ncbi:hypothetical protein [Luteitalea sp.]|uniref:hypothetical protein n=1 Tax=Luteitalea sp. TaxID=2004800 RepID=UPI0025C32BDE|nr:hypothetical protein [Luteitalea sp.]
MQRTHLHGHTNITKRLLVHAAAFNLWLLMRRALGVGTPRGLQSRAAQAIAALIVLRAALATVVGRWYATARTAATPLSYAWRLQLLPVELQVRL